MRAEMAAARLRWSATLRLAFRNILRHKGRAATTLAAVTFGVVALILSQGFVEDIFVQLAEAIIHSQTGHVQIAKEARDYLKITMPPTKVSVMEDNKPVEEEAWPVTVNGGAVMQKNDFVRIESHTPTSITTSPTTKASA